MGVRSSWLASCTKRRWFSKPDSSRSSMWLKFMASWATSSVLAVTSTRLVRSSNVVFWVASRSRRIGLSSRPVNRYPTKPVDGERRQGRQGVGPHGTDDLGRAAGPDLVGDHQEPLVRAALQCHRRDGEADLPAVDLSVPHHGLAGRLQSQISSAMTAGCAGWSRWSPRAG